MDNQDRRRNDVFSRKLKAGKKRTYFFDVRTTRNQDYYLTITESKKNEGGEFFERHKIFVYKEDLMKFMQTLQETIDHMKTELLPDFDFDQHAYNEQDEYSGDNDYYST